MENFNPTDLCTWTGGNWTKIPEFNLEGFCFDSRKARTNEIFVALRAERNGHEFLRQAVSSGVTAGLVDNHIQEVGCPQLVVKDTLVAFQQIAKNHRANFFGNVVGVTGSCGKTTTKEILRVLFPDALCTEGNLNNHIGVPCTLSKISPTAHSLAVVEAGINKTGEMDRLTEMINPDIAVITTVENSHLEGLGTLETVANEKIKLWLQAKHDSIGVFPEELLRFNAFSEAVKNKPSIIVRKKKYSGADCQENEAIYEISTETTECGHSQKLLIDRCGCPPLVISIPFSSAGTIQNMVFACVVAWKLGVTDEEICERLPQYRPSGLRGSCLVGRGSSYILDCYNANPASMLDSIHFFYERFENQSKLLVLGCMNELGEKADQLHYDTGKLIPVSSDDRIIIIGENSLQFANGLLQNGASEEKITILRDTESARSIIEDFRGVVLLKGSRSYQLESLIPSWAVPEFEPLKIAC